MALHKDIPGGEMKAWFKRLFHRHKYTVLMMYPPRPKYFSYTWGFLMECECGHKELTKLPGSIALVTEMITEADSES